MSPLRVDLTMRLADELGVIGERLRLVAAPMADDRPDRHRAHARADRGGGAGRQHRRRRRPRARARHRRQPGASRTCTTRPRTWSARASRRAARCGAASRCTAPTSPAACTTRCRTGPAASASTTTSRSASATCSTRAPSGWRTSTSTSTTATASSRSSGTTRGCSPSPCTRPGRCSSPAPASPNDRGGPDAQGTAVNVALPPGTADAGWLRAFHAVVPPLLREFAPDVLVTQHGCDSHVDDPLAHLMLTVDGQRAAYLALHDLAHEVCGGRWVVTGGGGYALVEVVPRAWTHLLAIVGGRPLDPADRVRRRPGASTSAPSSAGPRPCGSPTAGPRRTATGRRATTRTPGWTGRSTRRARRSSRSTAWTRCPDLR